MSQKWDYFCIRNYRLNFGKIDLRWGKELALRKQIQYVNNSIYHCGLIAGGIFDENLTDSSLSKVHPLQLGESMMRRGNKVKESNTKKSITLGVSGVIYSPGCFIPNWVYLQRVGDVAGESLQEPALCTVGGSVLCLGHFGVSVFKGCLALACGMQHFYVMTISCLLLLNTSSLLPRTPRILAPSRPGFFHLLICTISSFFCTVTPTFCILPTLATDPYTSLFLQHYFSTFPYSIFNFTEAGFFTMQCHKHTVVMFSHHDFWNDPRK